MLFDMRNNLDSHEKTSELKRWLVLNGRDTVEKFKEFEKNNFKKVLKFSGYFFF